MPFIKTNDINIYYEIYGKGDPLILICGFTENHFIWQNFIGPLSKRFQVVVFDNRGAGQTEAPLGGYSIQMFAEDTIGLMNALNLESAHFMGDSMGTLIIQQLCLQHPDRVKKAVLYAPFAQLPPITKYQIQYQLKLLESGFEKKALLELNASWLLSNRFIENPRNVEQFIRDILSDPFPQTMEGLLGQADALFEADFRKELHNISHEILLLAGGKDISTPPYCAELMKEQIPFSEIYFFKEMGHLFHYEIPEHTSKLTLEFLLQN